MKRTSVLVAVTTLALGVLAACGGNKETDGSATETRAASNRKTIFRTADKIKKSGVICIGIFTNKAPFGYVDASGANQGYDVVYAQRIAQDPGVRAEFTSLDPAARAEYINTSKAGITLTNFTVTKEKAEQADFVKPYMKVAFDVVSPEKTVTHSVGELKGKTLITAKGTTVETCLEKNYPEVKLQKYGACVGVYNALFDGRGNASPADNTEVTAWAKANPGFEVDIDSLGDYGTIAAVVAKSNETLLNFLNEEIVTFGREDSFRKDYDETLKPIFSDTANPNAIVMEGGELGDTKQ